MKNKTIPEEISTDLPSPLNYTLEALKIGHTTLSGLMYKSPTSTAIAIFNDAVLNIGISSTAQKKSLGKSTVEFIGGFAAGSVCTISTSGFGAIASATCGIIGSEISGKLYDTIAQANGYDDTEQYIQKYYNTDITFEVALSRYKVLDKLKDGDYAYVNLPFSGAQLYTKVDGQLKTVAIPPPDPSFLDSLYVEKSSVQLKTSAEDAVNIRVDSFLTENSLIPDYNVQIIGLDSITTERYEYNNSSKTYEKQDKVEKVPAEKSVSSKCSLNNPKSIDTSSELKEKIAEKQWSLNSSLRQAIDHYNFSSSDKNFSTIKSLLEEGADINGGEPFVGKDGYCYGFGYPNPIISATKSGNIKLVKFLISNGANINQKNNRERSYSHSEGETALMVAINAGDKEMYEFLIQSGASLDVQDSAGRTILHQVIGNEELVKYLLSKGARVDIQDCNGSFPINLLLYSNQFLRKLLIEKAIEQKANLESYYLSQPKDHFSWNDNLLHSCMKAREFQLVKLMIDNDLPTESLFENTPILEYLVCSLKYPQEEEYEIKNAINSLVNHGVDMSDGKALFKAISSNLYDIANLLIEAGSNVNYSKDGKNLLHLMISKAVNSFSYNRLTGFSNEEVSIIKLLISKKIKLGTVLEYLLDAIIKYNDGQCRENLEYYTQYLVPQGFEEICLDIIDSGIDLSYYSSSKYIATYLEMAVDKSQYKIAKKLIEKGVLERISNESAFRALEKATMTHQVNIVSLLVNSELKTDNKAIENLLIEATRKNQLNAQIIDSLCIFIEKQTLEANYVKTLYNKAFLTSVEYKFVDAAEILLKHGADINTGLHDKEKLSPFHEAAYSGHTDVINFYLKHGIDPNLIYGDQKCSVLYYAVVGGNQEIAIKLLEAGADPSVKGGAYNFDIWKQVLREECVDVAKYMLEHGTTVTEKNLHYVTREQSIEMLEVLLQNSQLVNCRGYSDRTLLHIAVLENDVEKLKLLIQHEANLNLESTGLTALEVCVGNFRQGFQMNKSIIVEIMDILIGSGAVIRPTVNDKSLLGIAASHGNEQSVQYLIDKGLKVDILDKYLCSPLHYASSLEVVEILVATAQEVGINVEEYINATDQEGYSVLWRHAPKNRYIIEDDTIKIVQYLLDNGANPNLIYKNKSLLHATIKSGTEEIVQMLISLGA